MKKIYVCGQHKAILVTEYSVQDINPIHPEWEFPDAEIIAVSAAQFNKIRRGTATELINTRRLTELSQLQKEAMPPTHRFRIN